MHSVAFEPHGGTGITILRGVMWAFVEFHYAREIEFAAGAS